MRPCERVAIEVSWQSETKGNGVSADQTPSENRGVNEDNVRPATREHQP